MSLVKFKSRSRDNIIKKTSDEFFNQNSQHFDIIFIDGLHSIHQVLKDWEYTNLLSDTGIVGLHDTSHHIGPFLFIRNLDKNKWDVIENACPQDYGIGFATKKKIKNKIVLKLCFKRLLKHV